MAAAPYISEGNNAYTQSEKLVYTFDNTTVVGNNAGHVVVGGKGAGSVMENGADITVDGVNVGYLTAGAAEGGVVNGDINVLVKSAKFRRCMEVSAEFTLVKQQSPSKAEKLEQSRLVTITAAKLTAI